MTATVTKVEPRNREGKKPDANIYLSDGTKAWCGDQAAAVALKVGEPLPADWEVSVGDYGPRANPPRPAKGFGGGASAYRNSKEGQFYEQERMDRRTALMQAVECWNARSILPVEQQDNWTERNIRATADEFYNWLRKSSDAVVPPKGAVDTPTVSPTASDPPSVEGNSKRGDLGSPSTSTTTAEDRGQVVDKTTLAYGEGESESDSITCPPHSPNEHADKRAGRFPCLTCGLYVRGTAG